MEQQAHVDLSSLIDSTEDLLWSVDLDHRLLAFNRAFRKHIEVTYGVSAAVGMRLEDLLPPERAALLSPFLDSAITRGSFRAEYPLLSGRMLELSFNQIADGGVVSGTSIFGKDITDRKASEQALQEVDRKYRDIFDGAIEGLFQTNLEGQPLAANQAVANMLGYATVDEVISAIADSADHFWADPAAYAKFKNQIVEQEAVRDFECQFKCKDGTKIWVSLSCQTVYGSDGRALFLQGFLEDVTNRKQAEMQLRDSEERYRSTFEQAAVGIVHTSFEGRFMRCNARFAEIIGYSPDEVPGLTFQKITSATNLASSVSVMHQLLAGVIQSTSWEKQYVRKDGSLTWAKVTVSVQRDGEGNALHFIAVIEDINSLKEAERLLEAASEAMRQSEERYRTAFHTTVDAVNINRLSDGMYIEVNKAFTDITGFEREEVIGRTSPELGIWADPSDRQKLAEILRVKSICRNLEARFRTKTGKIIWAIMSASVIEIDGVPCIFSITRDISDAKTAEEEIRNLAYYDPLTKLPNRRLLMDRLGLTLAAGNREKRKQALLFVDLDNFKNLNDTLGHQMGDFLLQGVAQRLTSCVREAGMVARLGGDEFVVTLENLSAVPEEAAAQAKSVGERILGIVSQPYLLDARQWRNTASIGITVFGDQQDTTDAVLQQADIATYQAKAAGRNTIRFFAPALQAAVNARAEMEDDLRRAISTSEFVLYYQPQVDAGHVVCAEALIRWRHPRRGLLSPAEFIPLAEETGLILPLGNWVLESACSQIAAWAGDVRTAEIGIAVNISARQVGQPNFVDEVLKTLNDSGANPENLELELTESTLVHSFEDVIAKMAALRSHGVKFSLDDFGTGYSSLSYLKRLPLDQLKIDQSFIRDLLVDANSGAIAQTIITLGQAMGLSVIAEGVEAAEQREFLEGLGCHLFQGYLFGAPLILEDFERMLQDAPDAADLMCQ